MEYNEIKQRSVRSTKHQTCRKACKNPRGTMLSVVCDMFLYRSLRAAGSGVADWSAGLFRGEVMWTHRE